jgi:hypothetical protein
MTSEVMKTKRVVRPRRVQTIVLSDQRRGLGASSVVMDLLSFDGNGIDRSRRIGCKRDKCRLFELTEVRHSGHDRSFTMQASL